MLTIQHQYNNGQGKTSHSAVQLNFECIVGCQRQQPIKAQKHVQFQHPAVQQVYHSYPSSGERCHILLLPLTAEVCLVLQFASTCSLAHTEGTQDTVTLALAVTHLYWPVTQLCWPGTHLYWPITHAALYPCACTVCQIACVCLLILHLCVCCLKNSPPIKGNAMILLLPNAQAGRCTQTAWLYSRTVIQLSVRQTSYTGTS